MNTLIMSDLHLGARNCQHRLILNTLDQEFDQLILNGDIVDSLDLRKFREGDFQVLNRLKRLSFEERLVLIRGNHDCPGKDSRFQDLLSDMLGTHMKEATELEVGSSKYLVMHGDQFDRSLNLTFIGDAAESIYKTAQRYSLPLARWMKRQSKTLLGIVRSVRDSALIHARKLGYDGIVLGHTHHAEDERVGDMHYLNSGSWVDENCHYLCVQKNQFSLHRHCHSFEATSSLPLYHLIDEHHSRDEWNSVPIELAF